MAAAVTLAVHTAVVARAVVRFAFSPTLPVGAGDALIVAPAQALDPALMATIGLDPNAVRDAWEQRVADAKPITPALPARRLVLRDNRGGEAMPTVPAVLNGSFDPAYRKPRETALAARGGDLAQRWARRFAAGSDWRQFFSALSDRGSRAVDTVLSWLRNASVFDRPQDRQQIDAGASLILAQGFRSDDATDVATIATAPDSESLWRAVQLMVRPDREDKLRGRLSVMNDAGDVLQATDAARIRYVRTQPFGVENARLLAAGWLSLNPLAYVASALFLAGLLTIATFSLVRSVGRGNG